MSKPRRVKVRASAGLGIADDVLADLNSEFMWGGAPYEHPHLGKIELRVSFYTRDVGSYVCGFRWGDGKCYVNKHGEIISALNDNMQDVNATLLKEAYDRFLRLNKRINETTQP